LLLIVVSACGPGRQPARVDNYEVVLEITADGALDVQERIAVAPDPARSFRRRVRSAFFDGVSFVATTGSGSDLSQVTAEDGRSLDVTWSLVGADRPGLPRVYGLRYRVEGVLAVEGAQRRLTWTAIPPHRAYEIGTATVTLRVPPGVALLTPSGMAEAGWVVSMGSGELAAGRERIPAAEPGTVMALLSGDRFPAREPDWQFDRARASELAPAFLAGAAFILVVAAGALVMLWRQGAGGPVLARQLRAAAIASIVLGVVTGVIAELVLSRLGIWPQAIPASLVLSGLSLGAASLQTRRRQYTSRL
jgi:hypothetical protein